VGPARRAVAQGSALSAAASPRQLEALAALRPAPLVLFHEFSCADERAASGCRDALAALAQRHGGALRWAAQEQEVLCGRIAHFQQAARLHLPSPAAAQAFVTSPAHAAALAAATAVQVAVLGEQPRAVAIVSALLAKVLPHWPFDDTIEPGDEPGVGVSSVMPTAQAIAALRAHPEQDTPVVMINWLKFRPPSGKAAYYRYGRIAMATTHSIGAKLLFAARYRMILVGNGGDPGRDLWDEFALMQYPGRATFGTMASLRRYRAGLADREAGLAENGQGLTVSRPAPEFTWRS
jgi:hypothetical protein